MPRRPRPRVRPPTQRKKTRHRYAAPPAASVEPGTPARVVPFPVRSVPTVVDARPASPGVRAQDYGYVLRELRRIVITGVAMLVIVVIFSFVLR